MPRPRNIKAIDLMLNIPGADHSPWYESIGRLFMDEESKKVFEMPAEYMFKNIPDIEEQDDYVAYTISEMDKWGIERAMLGVFGPQTTNVKACTEHPDRYVGCDRSATASARRHNRRRPHACPRGPGCGSVRWPAGR